MHFFRISKAVNRAVTLELLLKSTAQLRGSAVEPMGRKARQLRPRKGADEPIIESKKRDDQKAMDGARLLQLVLAGQTAAVEAMLQRKVDADSTDERGWPPLFHASQRGQPSMVKLLLAHKALATFAGMTGETALMVASEQGQTKIANMLLAASCSVNLAANDGTTALMGACLHSRIDMVRLLLEKKASVGARTIQGGTALAVACHGDKVLSAEIVKLLLSCRATVDAPGQFAQTPLIAACQNGHFGAVEALLDHKANINHETTLGQSALTTAAMANERDIANLLASRGALLSLASLASKAASKEPKQDPFLVPGSHALIENLVSASDLNGLTGEIVGFDTSKGRHAVRLPNGEEKLIKPANLKPLGNHSIDLCMRGYVRKLVKLMKLKLEREAVPEDFLCLIQSLDENHLQCTMQLPSVMPSNALILGTVVDISRHPDEESAKQEAVDGAALQAIKALRRSDNVDDELSPCSSASGEEDDDTLEHELTQLKNIDMDDPEALAALAERVNESISKHASALRADDEDSSSDSEPDRRAFYKAFGMESKLKVVANGNQMHTFFPSIDNLVAGGKCTHWSPGTPVITQDGKRGSIILYDATAKVYSVKLKGGKERCFKRSQLRRAPMPKQEAKKFVEAIAKWEKENHIGTFITKHMKIFRVPKEQIPSQYRKSLQGKDLIWMVHQDTRAWPDGVEFQGEALFIDPLVAQRKDIFGEDWFNAVDATFPAKQVPFRTLPPDVATEMFRMLDESQKEQSGSNLDPRLQDLLQERGMVSIEYNSSVSMSEALWKNDAEPFRLSPEEMWGLAGGTLDGFAQKFPGIALHCQDMLETDASTHFAAMDELQSQNARVHEAHKAERKKKEEALQILEETQRLHEAKEKQHQDRERSLLEQLQDAETDFAKLQAALEKEKKVALNALRAEIERLQATLQEQEAAFRKKELKLVRERQDAMESLNTSTNQEELEAVLQELTAKSAELSKQEQILAEKDFFIQSQAQELEAKQLQLSRDRADVSAKRESLLEARHQLEEQRRRVEQRFAVPDYWVSRSGSDDVSFVPVIEDRTIGALQAAILIDNLDWIGWGRDQACPAQHSGLELLWAWRVEHQGLWAKYRAEQCKMRADLKVSGIQVQPVDIKESLQAATKDLAQLDAEVNEVFLLHGTDPSKVLQIAREGLNERFSSRSCFGFGSYLAEDAGKVDQYIKPEEFFRRNNELHSKLYLGSRRHPGRTFYIFVCRASLGMMARSRDGQWTLDGHSVWAQTKQRARQREFEFAPEAWPKLRYHSQVVETTPPEEMGSVPAGSTVVERYREFMTTHSERIYPEYLLAVRRAQERPIY